MVALGLQGGGPGSKEWPHSDLLPLLLFRVWLEPQFLSCCSSSL